MKSIEKKEFESNINVDDGYRNNSQGIHKSTMELFSFNNGDCIPLGYQIEWDIPSLETTVHINIEYEQTGMKVIGYDGVFEMPEQAIELLEKHGFNCEEIKD